MEVEPIHVPGISGRIAGIVAHGVRAFLKEMEPVMMTKEQIAEIPKGNDGDTVSEPPLEDFSI